MRRPGLTVMVGQRKFGTMTKETLPYSGEIARKALHLLAMAIPVGMLLLDRHTGLAILIPLAILAIFMDRGRSWSAAYNAWIEKHMGFMMRDSERGMEREARLNGAAWVMLTAALLLIVFPPRIAAPAMVIAMIADAGAALVGRRWGTHHWPGSRRTLEGTAAYVVTGLAAALFFPEISLVHRLTAIGVSAVVEILPLRINDNLLLPFAAATVLWMMAGLPPLW